MPDQSLSLLVFHLRQLLRNPDRDGGYHRTITVSHLLTKYIDKEGLFDALLKYVNSHPESEFMPTSSVVRITNYLQDLLDFRYRCDLKMVAPQKFSNCWFIAVTTLCVRLRNLFNKLPEDLQMIVTDTLKTADNVCPRLPVHLLNLMAARKVLSGRVQDTESIRGPGSAPGFLECLLEYAELQEAFSLHRHHFKRDITTGNMADVDITMGNVADVTTWLCIRSDADGGLLTLEWEDGTDKGAETMLRHTWSFTYCPGVGVIFCSWGMCHEAEYGFVRSFDLELAGDVKMAHWCLIEEVEPKQPRFQRNNTE